MTKPSLDLPASLASRFEAVRALGAGAQGRVILARQCDLGRLVVVKVLETGFQDQEEARLRFRQEAQVTARLEHPHVVRVLDHGLDPDGAWIISEYVEGESLRQRLDRGPSVLRIAGSICALFTDTLTGVKPYPGLSARMDLAIQQLAATKVNDPDFQKAVALLTSRCRVLARQFEPARQPRD